MRRDAGGGDAGSRSDGNTLLCGETLPLRKQGQNYMKGVLLNIWISSGDWVLDKHDQYNEADPEEIAQEMEVIVPDSSKINPTSGMVESKSVGTFSPFQRQYSHLGHFTEAFVLCFKRKGSPIGGDSLEREEA
ncbi:hypothetical protein MKW98_009613 [Papaver atlanticum]|uniref:Uncharacterized protein n=1 Tax=Papaver atlanticum TaxID=357466 RepID=A0AAD4SCU3_9MAGN|nr:hypothetical protein MKW98_009613 [Papaver atlanticum]